MRSLLLSLSSYRSMTIETYYQAIEQQGFYQTGTVLDNNRLAALREAARSLLSRRQSKTYGIRRLLEVVPAARSLCSLPGIRALVEPILGADALPVRGLFFDKNRKANWGVSWHQDLTIAVRQRIDTPGFSCWSLKDGVTHVQPPAIILERMLTLRVHLDDTDADNGALRVIPSSHSRGRLSPEKIRGLAQRAVTCCLPCGGVLAMRPLLVHSSQPARKPLHRRIIQIEFAAEPLTNDLEWYGS